MQMFLMQAKILFSFVSFAYILCMLFFCCCFLSFSFSLCALHLLCMLFIYCVPFSVLVYVFISVLFYLCSILVLFYLCSLVSILKLYVCMHKLNVYSINGLHSRWGHLLIGHMFRLHTQVG